MSLSKPEKFVLIEELLELGAMKVGDFTLKSGQKSNLYFDLRLIYSSPVLLSKVVDMFQKLFYRNNSEFFDLVCGVPSAGVPYATAYSLKSKKPMILVRKEVKGYGTGQLIEGVWKVGDKILLIEDVMTTGSSTLEIIEILKGCGLQVVKIGVVIDRRELTGNVSNVISLLTMADIQEYLKLKELKMIPDYVINQMKERKFNIPLAQRLWDIVIKKGTNLCLSIDVDEVGEILPLLESVADQICMLKIHYDIFPNSEMSFISSRINQLAEEREFIVLNDRKYADIGSVIQRQIAMEQKAFGKFHAVTAHSLFGKESLNGFEEADVNIFLVAESSSKDNLITDIYTQTTVTNGYMSDYPYVPGFICQRKIELYERVYPTYSMEPLFSENYLYLTPGVNLELKGDSLGQTYRTPEEAIVRDECDIIIVGRGIYGASDRLEAAKAYRTAGWEALKKRYKD